MYDLRAACCSVRNVAPRRCNIARRKLSRSWCWPFVSGNFRSKLKHHTQVENVLILKIEIQILFITHLVAITRNARVTINHSSTNTRGLLLKQLSSNLLHQVAGAVRNRLLFVLLDESSVFGPLGRVFRAPVGHGSQDGFAAIPPHQTLLLQNGVNGPAGQLQNGKRVQTPAESCTEEKEEKI